MLINDLEQKPQIKSPRNTYGETLVELGAKNPNIVVLDADLSCSTQTAKFAAAYPNRFFNCGIAEQDLMGTAAGLAYGGKIAFASTFAMFATARCLDQIRNTICYSKLNVKIVATHGGITVGEDGASHQALEDISYMRSIPDMKVIVPSDCNEVKQVIEAIRDMEVNLKFNKSILKERLSQVQAVNTCFSDVLNVIEQVKHS